MNDNFFTRLRQYESTKSKPDGESKRQQQRESVKNGLFVVAKNQSDMTAKQAKPSEAKSMYRVPNVALNKNSHPDRLLLSHTFEAYTRN